MGENLLPKELFNVHIVCVSLFQFKNILLNILVCIGL